MHHVHVYREEGRFAGWPANGGVWSWGDEIVVAFNVGYMHLDVGTSLHKVDRSRPMVTMLARSTDGGETWTCAEVPFPKEPCLDPPTEPVDFTAPGFAMRCTGSSYFMSFDKCATWQGPYALHMSDKLGIQARTDYIVNSADDCMVFLTAAKENGKEGRVYCIRTTDGGLNWNFVSWIGPEPEGFSIMPASVKFSDGRMLVGIRRKEPEEINFIEFYESTDDGATWQKVQTTEPNCGNRSGNPPAMVLMKDGRLALTYGYRDDPISIRARVSENEGRTWSKELVLRDDGGDRDVGYSRTVQREDGKLVTAYYFNQHTDGERFIGATIWSADEIA